MVTIPIIQSFYPRTDRKRLPGNCRSPLMISSRRLRIEIRSSLIVSANITSDNIWEVYAYSHHRFKNWLKFLQAYLFLSSSQNSRPPYFSSWRDHSSVNNKAVAFLPTVITYWQGGWWFYCPWIAWEAENDFVPWHAGHTLANEPIYHRKEVNELGNWFSLRRVASHGVQLRAMPLATMPPLWG